VDPYGNDVIIFHSWNASQTRREMHGHRIVFDEDGPHLGGAIGEASSREESSPIG
jgi:hypothetical protein